MAVKVRTPEQKLAWLARRAHGVVTRGELVGHKAPSVDARYMAAVKACGKGALLSGPAAAWLWGLVKGPVPPPEVTAPNERKLKGIITTVPATLVRIPSLLSKTWPERPTK